MAKKITVKSGDAAVVIDETMKLSKDAGKLSPAQLGSLPTVRKGAGIVCEDVATAMVRLDDEFTPPRGVTPEMIRNLGARADGYDRIITGLETLIDIFKQANRIADAEAATMLSRIYDQVKTQAKDNPQLKIEFSSLYRYNATTPRTRKPKKVVSHG